MPTGILSIGIPDEEGAESGDEEVNLFNSGEKVLIDTTIKSELASFINVVRNLSIEDGASELVSIIELRLPVVNSKIGRSQIIHKIAHCVKEFLPKGFPLQRIGKLSKKNLSALKEAAATYCSTSSKLETLKGEVLKALEEQMAILDPTLAESQKNTEINRIALLSWLLVYPPANEWFEKLSAPINEEERPAYIEQPGGPAAFRLQIYGELIKVSEAMKQAADGIDSTIFDASIIGTDAAAACSRVYPRAGSFKDAEHLKSGHTALVNRYKLLEQRVFSSGFSKGTWSKDTYERAYERSGESGKTKDVGLFYAFVVFSKAHDDILWISRDFADTIGESSLTKTIVSAPTKSALTKREVAKDVERIGMLAKALGTTFGQQPQTLSPAKRARETDDSEEKERLKYLKLTNLEKKLQMWQSLRSSSNFDSLSEQRQIAIEENIFDIMSEVSSL